MTTFDAEMVKAVGAEQITDDPNPAPSGRRSGSRVVLTPASAITPERVRWTKKGLVPEGELTLVVGMPGDGKSTMLIDDAACLTNGTLEGDHFGAPVSVAIATAEDGPAAVVVPRLMAAGADRCRVSILHLERDGMTGALVLTPEKVDEIAAVVKAAGIRLLVFDPLVAFLPGKIDTHRDAAVRQVLAPLARHAEAAAMAIVCVIHLNKGQVQDVLYRVSGSIGFVGAARSVLLVARDPEAPDGDTRILAHAKCNLGPKAPARRFTIVGQAIESGGETIPTSRIVWGDEVPNLAPADLLGSQSTEDRSAVGTAMEFLEALLSTSPNGTETKAIYREARKLGIADRTLERAKSRLHVKSKHNGQTGAWYWRLDGARPPTVEIGDLAFGPDAATPANGQETVGFDTAAKDAKSKGANGLGDLARTPNGYDL